MKAKTSGSGTTHVSPWPTSAITDFIKKIQKYNLKPKKTKVTK